MSPDRVESFDLESIQSLARFFGPERAAELVERVPASLAERVAELRAAGWEFCARAHKIAGLARTYGLAALGDAAEELERGHEGLVALTAAVAHIEALARDATEHLNKVLGDLKQGRTP
jgi:HPt (histidine-containing phosphotransfer) domain-containing protein